MAGVEAVVGGAFVAGIIKEVVKTGRSYLVGKYKEHKGTQKMLDNLEASLPRVLFAIGLAEQKTTVQNATMREWLKQLKDIAYEAEDIMDDFEAKRIRDNSKNKSTVSEITTSSARAVKSVLFLSDKDEKKLKSLIEKIKNICDGMGDFIKMIETGNKKNASDGLNSSTGETTSFLSKTRRIFGREKEIELILNLITGYREIESNTNNELGDDLGLVNNESTHDDASPVSGETVSPSEDTQRSPVIKREGLLTNLRWHENPVFDISDSGLESQEKNVSFSTFPKFLEEGHYISTFENPYAKVSFTIGKRHISVLPIVGIGGVGKTTVARFIYNHSRVQDHFDLQGWVYVGDSTDHTRIVQDILCSFDVGTSNKTPTITRLNDGYHTLKNAISEKKFLIVFDDVTEGREGFESTWEALLELLAEGARESIVIVTTETKSVADALGTFRAKYLDVLKWEDFLALFEYHAYGYCSSKTGKHYEETELRPIGTEIAKKLGCLPLAAEVVGTLLRIKPDKNHWEKILESNWWDLENTSKKILLSLGASFRNLDPDLQQCFLYCSLFPKNHVFDKDRLVQMWMAHGLIQPTEEENFKLEARELNIEDIGHCRFDKLVDRFFFQITVMENRYVMHDLIRELAIAVSFEMLYISGNRLIDDKNIPSFVRHLAIDPSMEDDVFVDHMQLSDENIKNLRTIMFFGFCKVSKGNGIHGILDKLGGLRLLDLSYIGTSQFSLVSLPDRVTSHLSHLRFLDLSFSGITKVPKSLCELVHLQVLDMRGCVLKKLPDRMNRLINLRHLYASPNTISLIRRIGSLTNLQELEEFHVRGGEGFTISELKDLKLLKGQLTIRYIEEASSRDKAIGAKLEEKKYLTSLIFDMARNRNELPRPKNVKHVEVLEGLKPHKNVHAISIKRFMWITLPSWMMKINGMDKLRSIELTKCFSLETLPPLGSLPKLEVLILVELISIICIGEEFHGTSSVIFPCLRELTFSNLWKWERWSDARERQLFPCLQKLEITNCYQLSEVPLQCLNSSVAELHLSKCDEVIKNIGRYFAAMTSLTKLYLHGQIWLKLDLCCDHLHEVEVLTLGDVAIPHLNGQISSLGNLKKLSFPRYREQISISDRQHLQNALQARQNYSLSSLACIEVHNCFGIPQLLFSLGKFPSLRSLWINNCDRYIFTSEEDSWLEGLPSLEQIEFSNCEFLRCLPPSLSTLPALKKFTLNACPMILSFHQEGLPRNLKELCITECSARLMRECKPDEGTEWPKISHIPYIRVGKQTVQNFDDFPQ